MAIIIYLLFQLLHLYVFMYQRTTLTVARIMGIEPSKVQVILTPNWMGGLGWLSTIGFYGSVIYLWINLGFWWAIGGFILSHLVFAIVPIPQQYFYNILTEHLKREIKRTGSNHIPKEILEDLLKRVLEIKSNYIVD